MDQDVVVLRQRLLEIASLHLQYLTFFSVPSLDLRQELPVQAACPSAQLCDFEVSLLPPQPVLEHELPFRC